MQTATFTLNAEPEIRLRYASAERIETRWRALSGLALPPFIPYYL
jgi:hypothetical protein